MKAALRRRRGEHVVDARAGVSARGVAGGGGAGGLRVGRGGCGGEGVGDEEGVAVDFGKVAAFDVVLEV